MFVRCNPNPDNITVGDCVVRAIACANNDTWEDVYWDLCKKGFQMCDMPSSNVVWSSYLKGLGYKKFVIPNTCPNCYSIEKFCNDNKNGTYILATGTHVVAVIDGDYYDTWDSGHEIPVYFFKKGVY
jgi:hypothetical protein